MAEQRDFPRTVVAFSAFVVAVCAVVLTIKGMSTGFASGKQQRVLDPEAVTKLVTNEAGSTRDGATPKVSCPVSVVVEVGSKFDCRADTGVTTEYFQVTIMDEQGSLSISSR
ncbi:DUF4333 domain-containing protein [Actinocrispum sp. NPDC049592]|uniref:DUF4333 domain-containing protein n=1 Tax=Actinocrispum sp. NPDC049592 TaxID=3154835 RepID=UPI0034486418